MALATLVSIIWGLAFVAIKYGLDSFSAPQLTIIRFVIGALPAFFVPPPRRSFAWIVAIGLSLFTGQFLLLFFAYSEGLPAGLASVTQQMQAFFTVLLAAIFLRDLPSVQQCAGMTIAFTGLALIALTVGSEFPPVALALALAGALSWAVGNVLVKHRADIPVFPLVVWCSLIPPLPALALSLAVDPTPDLVAALAGASWLSIGAALYLGVGATTVAYAIWGRLLQDYPTGAVAPFALIAPCTGVVASAIAFGEVFSPLRYAGMALVLTGLAVVVLRRIPVGSPRSVRGR